MTKPARFHHRKTAILRGLDFIHRAANTPAGFDEYGGLITCCFALIAATSCDAQLRLLSRTRTQELAERWRRRYPNFPTGASADLISGFVMVSYALSRVGLGYPKFNAQINAAAAQFKVHELFGFDPANEPPPTDLAFSCGCGLNLQRGRTFCKGCRKRLDIQSRYRVWMNALVSTYVSQRCRIRLGAGYADVLRWLPKMRPYLVDDGNIGSLRETVYAVTHVVYTLNDYGTYRLSSRDLPQEFAFLKENVALACDRNDPEILGELLDSLKSFGIESTDPLIERGTRYLLERQNEDGSWGDPNEENIRTRCHTTWTAIDGLRSYAWRGERSQSPKINSILERSAKRS